MSTKYLNDSGLGYFWSKIKAWCNATFAAIIHNQASNTINAMTGYSKPGSGSAIAASDSLNAAIGKLEAKVDSVDDSNYVHKTGDELVNGFKTFTDQYTAKNLDIVRGTRPQTNKYSAYSFDDSNGHIVAGVEYAARASGSPDFGNSKSDLKLWVEKYAEVSNNEGASLVVGYDDQDIRYAACPSTSTSRTFGRDIVTRDFIPNDTRIVHTTGGEEISGVKSFLTSPICLKSAVPITTPPASNDYNTYAFVDSNGTRIGGMQFVNRASGQIDVKLYCMSRDGTQEADLFCGFTPNGVKFTSGETPPADSNTDWFATTAWVRTFCSDVVRTSGAQRRCRTDIP